VAGRQTSTPDVFLPNRSFQMTRSKYLVSLTLGLLALAALGLPAFARGGRARSSHCQQLPLRPMSQAPPLQQGAATPADPAPAVAEQPQKAASQGEPAPGVETAERLTERDEMDRVRKGSYAKVYTVQLKAKQIYVIDLVSPGGMEWFDPYLRIEDEEGKPLAEDNDSGGRMNARLVVRPARDREYRLVVTSFQPQATGVFFLSVRPRDSVR
jgi:hypothetical protein